MSYPKLAETYLQVGLKRGYPAKDLLRLEDFGLEDGVFYLVYDGLIGDDICFVLRYDYRSLSESDADSNELLGTDKIIQENKAYLWIYLEKRSGSDPLIELTSDFADSVSPTDGRPEIRRHFEGLGIEDAVERAFDLYEGKLDLAGDDKVRDGPAGT